jgi:hypothetical protein
VHRLDPAYRDGAALLDEVVRQMLPSAHTGSPLITLSQIPQGGTDGEVRRHDAV